MAKKNGGNNSVWRLSGILIGSFITVITLLSLFITTGLRTDISQIRGKIDAVDSKLFVHLTNHELHVPRASIVSKEEYELYRYTSEKSLEQIAKTVESLKKDIQNIQK